MTGWSELVTTALLGTDRRPVPHDLPTGWAGADPGPSTPEPALRVLELAARHRAAVQAGSPPARLTPPERAPLERLTLAPPEAQQLLGDLLVRPEPPVVNLWLAECARRGLGAAPDLWPRLAQLAARHREYHRAALLEVLGPRGRWFLSQFPDGARLLAGSRQTPPQPVTGTGGDAGPASSRAAGPADTALELLLAVPDPWSPQVAAAAVRLLADGSLGAQTRLAAVLVGARLPLDQAGDLLASAAAGLTRSAPGTVGAARVAEMTLALVERTVRSRAEISTAFSAAGSEESPS